MFNASSLLCDASVVDANQDLQLRGLCVLRHQNTSESCGSSTLDPSHDIGTMGGNSEPHIPKSGRSPAFHQLS